MGTVMIKLREVRQGQYALFGPKGNQISGIYQGSKEKAKEWARSFCSTWPNWGVQVEWEHEQDLHKM